MKILLLIIIVFTLDVFAQSSIVVGTGATIDLGTGTNLDVGSYSGTFTGNGAINSSPLPVELTSFTASISNGQVLLNWETATEVNNYGFEIQRSSTPLSASWELLGFVPGHGTTNSPKYYEFTDSELPNSDEVSYRLKQIDNDGAFEYSKTITVDLTNITSVESEDIPKEYSLSQNYPNPFNPSTTIQVALPDAGTYRLNVYNLLGQHVGSLFNGQLNAGVHSFNFDATNLSTGVYIYSLKGEQVNISKKMSLMK